ncbi:helix-turn-helix transcriptional regulator [Ochrobactrum sp. BD67]
MVISYVVYTGLFVSYKDLIGAYFGPVKNFLSYKGVSMAFLHLTDAHMRAARGLLNWNQQRLADESGLAVSTIKRLENGGISKASIENIEKIATALERVGIEFFNGGEPGVRLRRPPVAT